MQVVRRQVPGELRSFADLTTEELRWIEEQLNDRPRKSLGYKTPRQVMEMALAA